MKRVAHIDFYQPGLAASRTGGLLEVAIKKEKADRLGLKIWTEAKRCGSCGGRWPYECISCRAYEKERRERNEITRQIEKRLKLPFARTGYFFADRRPAILHVRDVAGAREARSALVREFRKRGYRVFYRDDRGGIVQA